MTRRATPEASARSLDRRIVAIAVPALGSLIAEPLYLLVDTSASMGLGDPRKLDVAKRLAAGLAYVGLSSSERVAVIHCAPRPTNRPGAKAHRRDFPTSPAQITILHVEISYGDVLG